MSQVYVNPSQAGGLVLSELKVRRFRSLYEVSLPLKQINIFVGPNGSGKSNLILLFRFLYDCITDARAAARRYKDMAREIPWLGEEENREFEVILSLEAPLGERHVLRMNYRLVVDVEKGNRITFPVEELTTAEGHRLFSRTGDKARIGEQTYSVSLISPLLSAIARQDLIVAIPPEDSDLARQVFEFIRGWRVFEIDPARIRRALYEPIDEESFTESLDSDGENLGEFLYTLQRERPDDFELIVWRLTAAIDFLEEVRPIDVPTLLGSAKVWRFKEESLKALLSTYAESDGTLRLLAILTLLLGDRTPSLILLEEPDQNLHPWLMLHLADAMRYHWVAEEPFPQILVTTHSPDFLDCFYLDSEDKEYIQVFTVRKEEGKTNFRVETDALLSAWLEDYRLGDLLKKGVVGR